MTCAWQDLKSILPAWIRNYIDPYEPVLQELRLRRNQPSEAILRDRTAVLDRTVTADDLTFVINTASRYSPWAAETMSRGFLTAPGGHRIGICGEAVMEQGCIRRIRNVRSLCVRIARDFPGLADGLPSGGSLLIIGRPGAGKTTLLRDLIRQRSRQGPMSIAVVDERGELFPDGFSPGIRTDILTGCGKQEGIPLALRTMGPGTIAVDEVTEEADSDALIQAFGCGVDLLATAHAASVSDLRNRLAYRKLLQYGIFQTVVILQSDKSWRTERISI